MAKRTPRVPSTPRPRNLGKYGKPKYNQARKIVAKFGGEMETAKMLGLSYVTIYRWQYAPPYGRDGIVPSRHHELIRQAARLWGIFLTDEDWRVERIRYAPDDPQA